MTSGGTAAKLDLLGNSQLQKQVQGMLNDMNRVKNMKMDGPVAFKQRRDNSTTNVESRNRLALLGKST